jgi:hypothetical protein
MTSCSFPEAEFRDGLLPLTQWSSVDSKAVPVCGEHLANDDEAPDTREAIHRTTEYYYDEKGYLWYGRAKGKQSVGPGDIILENLHRDHENLEEARF